MAGQSDNGCYAGLMRSGSHVFLGDRETTVESHDPTPAPTTLETRVRAVLEELQTDIEIVSSHSITDRRIGGVAHAVALLSKALDGLPAATPDPRDPAIRIGELKHHIAKLTEQVYALGGEPARLVQHPGSDEPEDTRVWVAQMETELDEASGTIEAQRARIANLTDALEAQTETTQRAHAENTDLRRQLGHLTQENAHLTGALNRAGAAIDELRDAHRTEQAYWEHVSDELDAVRAENTDLRTTIRKLAEVLT